MIKKYPFLLEVPFFYLGLFALNQVFFHDRPGFVGVEPHPFWMGIILFSIRYGINVGFFTGLTSSVVYMASIWSSEVDRYLFEDMSFFVLPGLFIILGAMIGMGAGKRQKLINYLKQEQSDFTREIKKNRDDIKALGQINQVLEKRIVTKMSTLVTLYEGARRMELMQMETLAKAILDFVAKTLDVEEAALYLRAPGGWKLAESYHWKEFKKHPVEIKFNEGLTGFAGAKSKVVSIRDFVGSNADAQSIPKLLGDSFLSGPVLRGPKGEVWGVISIQAISFFQLNSSTTNLFTFLLDWASRSVGKALQYEELKSNDHHDEKYPVFSYRYFLTRAGEELDRSKTYYLPLSLGMVQVDTSGFDAEAKQKLLLAVALVVKSVLRTIDIVASTTREDFQFIFLLSTTSQSQAGEIKAKLLEKIRLLQGDISPQVRIDIGISSFTPKTRDLEILIEEAMGKVHESTDQKNTATLA